MQTVATLATLASVTLAGSPSCAVGSVDHSYKRAAVSYKAPAYGVRSYGKSYGARSYGKSYGYDDDYSYGDDYGYGDDYDLDYGYGARSYGKSYGRRSYGKGYGVGRRGHGAGRFGKAYGGRRSYGGKAYGLGRRSYGGYGAKSYGYDRDYDYGYGRDLDYGYGDYDAGYGYGRGYGYEPVVVKKDYGLWENYYRLEVETFKKTVVTDTENVWVVAYIDPACGGCKKLATQWERLTTAETITVRKVKFGYLDITVEENREILETYTGGATIEATPTIYLYGRDTYAPTLYYGDYTVDSLNDYICGYCDDYGYGVVVDDYGYGDYDLGYGYGDSYGDYGYGRRSYGAPKYGRKSYGYGYDAAPKVLSTYGRTRQSRVEDVDYDRTVREGRSYGGYERTTVEPAYGYSGYDW